MAPRQKILVGAGVALTLLSCALLSQCGRPAGSGAEIVRLVDEFGAATIVKSPFLALSPSQLRDAGDALFPVHTEPLRDTPGGPDRFGLARKLTYGGGDSNILFAPPASDYIFDPAWSAGDVLEFGLGIKRDVNSEKLRKDHPPQAEDVTFAVALESNGREKELFTHVLSAPYPGEDSRVVFSFHRIVLPARNEKTRLLLRTRGLDGAFAFWIDPILFKPKTDAINVIIVSLDTLRADHLGCFGYGRPTSPAFDELAADSALFLRTYAPSPWTLSSHVSIMTGLVGPHHQVLRHDERMNPALTTLAEILRGRGFFCWAITGGGFVSSKFGFGKGFDFYSETEGDFAHPNSAELVENAAASWLKGHADRSFFLFLHTYQLHAPYYCPAPYNRMFLEKDALWSEIDIKERLGGQHAVFRPLPDAERRNAIGLYDGEIRYADEALIRPLVAELKTLGLYDRTMLILLSDHGEEFYEHGSWMHTNQLYQESLRVPLLIKFPGSGFRGLKSQAAVRLVDVLPTVLETLGINPKKFPGDGRSLLPILRGRETEDRPVWADVAGNLFDTHNSAKSGVIDGTWKAVWNAPYLREDLEFFSFPPPSRPPIELYDLTRDPEEKTNLIDLHPDVVRRLSGIRDRFLAGSDKRRSLKAEPDEELKAKLRALGYIR